MAVAGLGMKPASPAIALCAGQLLGAPAPANDAGHARLRVLAYDISQPRRAARVRRLLRRWAAGDGQHSVCEVQMGTADLHGLVDAVHGRLEANCDRLAVWQPARQMAWRLHAGSAPVALRGWPAYRLWVFAYDITDPQRLHAVQRLVAARCVAVQRSVYVLHGAVDLARSLAAAVLRLMADRDRVGIWPLQNTVHLWTTQASAPACLAIGPGTRSPTHRVLTPLTLELSDE